MAGYFFTSWELWQEMTFVLAMGIVSVFFAGLVKLWWTNRLMKKEEQLEAEKRARVEAMRKSGIPIKRANPVPFGIKAIQSGVEVEGIWISPPALMNETGERRTSSSAGTGDRDLDSQKKGQNPSEGEKPVRVTTATTNLGPKQGQSSTSVLQNLADSEPTDGSSSAAPPLSQSVYSKPTTHSSLSPVTLNEDALRRLEGRSPSPGRTYETSMQSTATKTSFPHRTDHPRRPNERSSAASSSGDSVDSQARSARSTSDPSYASSHSAQLYVAATAWTQHSQHSPGLRPWSEREEHRLSYEASPFSPKTKRQHQEYQQQGETGARSGSGSWSGPGHEMMAIPKPTLGPAELHYNSAARGTNGA
ncbi:hypothetical protein VTH06DRAFT_2591 [Thermothelomyces fergusii]